MDSVSLDLEKGGPRLWNLGPVLCRTSSRFQTGHRDVLHCRTGPAVLTGYIGNRLFFDQLKSLIVVCVSYHSQFGKDFCKWDLSSKTGGTLILDSAGDACLFKALFKYFYLD